MESLKSVSLAFIYGFWDSIKGMTFVLFIDAEIYKKNAIKQCQQQQRNVESSRLMWRSPSPVPSSASAMFADELQRQKAATHIENPDERRMDNLRKKRRPSEPAIPFKQRKIAKQVLKCFGLNVGFILMSIIIYHYIILPTIKFFFISYHGDSQDLDIIWDWLKAVLYLISNTMWLCPLYIINKAVCAIWFTEIADEAYKLRKGEKRLMLSWSDIFADFIFGSAIQMVFFIQLNLIYYVPLPYVCKILYYLHHCFLNSLCCFEYKWFNMGMELHTRLNYVEVNWPYFIGFAVPLTVLTSISDNIIVNGCIYSILFPLFILSSIDAKPIIGATNMSLPLFSPIVSFSNLICGGLRRILTANKSVQHKQHKQQQQHLQKNEDQLRSVSDNTQKISSTRTSTNEQQLYRTQVQGASSPAATQIRYNEGTRTLIPTQVPSPPPTVTSPSQQR